MSFFSIPLTFGHLIFPDIHKSYSSYQTLDWIIIDALLTLPHNLASNAPVAQLDRAPGYELGGRRFESFRARQSYRGAAAPFIVLGNDQAIGWYDCTIYI